MKNLSKKYYQKCLRFYLISYFVLCLFMSLLILFDSSFWIVYLLIISMVFIIICPFLISSIYFMIKSTKISNNKLMIGKIIDCDSSFSIMPMPRISLKLKLEDNSELSTNGIFDPKKYNNYKGKELQVLITKKRRVYALMFL